MPRASKLTKCVRCGKKPRFGLNASFYMLKWPADPIGRDQFKRTLPRVGYCKGCLLDRLHRKSIPKKKQKQLKGEIEEELRDRKKLAARKQPRD
jgi:hypothetical protein